MHLKLNLGCGKNILDGYLNVDLFNRKADIIDDITTLTNVIKICGYDYVEEIYSAHSLMCVPENKLLNTLKLWYKLLKEGGKLIIETTDFKKQIEEYINDRDCIKKVIRSLFGNNKDDGDGLRYQFDYKLLKYWLSKAGFRNIKKIKQPKFSKHNEEYNLCVKANK